MSCLADVFVQRLAWLSLVCHVVTIRMHFDPRSEFASEADRQRLVEILVEQSLSTHMLQQTNPRTLVRRYLPPGLYSDLYRLYMAERYAANAPVAGPATFYRTLRSSGWHEKIKFRGRSQHAQCAICHKLKTQIKKAQDLSLHAKYCDDYMRHLSGVFADRGCYDQMKSRASAPNPDIILVTIDSMDKSKFALPRLARLPKGLDTRPRPQCEVTACLVHGHMLCVYIADCEQTSGSDWSQEVISRSLEKCLANAQAKGQSWPRCLRIWSDNTPKAMCDQNNIDTFAPYCFLRHTFLQGDSKQQYGTVCMPSHHDKGL